MGSAQLILYENSKDTHSALYLRRQRNLNNQELVDKYRNQVKKLDIAYKLYTSFLDILSEKYQRLRRDTRRRNDLARLKYEWDRDYEPHLVNDFKKQKKKGQQSITRKTLEEIRQNSSRGIYDR